MKRILIFSLLLLSAAMGTMESVQAQPGQTGWVSTWQLNVDAEGKQATFQNSKVDTSEIIYWEGTTWCIDSLEFAVKTQDTASYTTEIIQGVGRGTPYVTTTGIDTVVSTTAKLDGARISYSVLEPGMQWIRYKVKYASTGNHVSSTRIATLKYEIWVKAYFRYKRVP